MLVAFLSSDCSLFVTGYIVHSMRPMLDETVSLTRTNAGVD